MIQSNKISLEEQEQHCPDALIGGGPKGELKHFEQECQQGKTPTYRPGSGIDIKEDLISTKIAKGLEYDNTGAIEVNLGEGLDFDENGKIKITQKPKEYSAGDGIDITNDIISAKVGNGVKVKDKKISLDTDFTSLPYTALHVNITDIKGIKTTYHNDTNITKQIIYEVNNMLNIRLYYHYTLSDVTSAPEYSLGDFIKVDIPPDNVPSEFVLYDNLIEDKSLSVELFKKGSGLIVDNNRVVVNNTEDELSRIISIKFYPPVYYGNNISESLDDVTLLTKKLLNSKVLTVDNITTNSNEYFYYIYPKFFGLLTNIIMDGAAPILGAFTMIKEMNIINEYGKYIDCYVYKTNDKGAFTKNKLAFL